MLFMIMDYFFHASLDKSFDGLVLLQFLIGKQIIMFEYEFMSIDKIRVKVYNIIV